MKIVSFVDATGVDRVGVMDGDSVRVVTLYASDSGWSPVRTLLSAHDPGVLIDRARREGERYDPSAISISPAVPDPSKIVAAPVNYRKHQAEMAQDAHVGALGVFLKAPSSVVAHGGTVRLPYVDRRFDQEGELAVVIGKAARNVAVEDAFEHVFGYTCLLDMTMRGGEDRSTRKSFDTFTPVGPHIVTAGDMPPLDQLELRTLVNGELRQRAEVSDLIWDVPQLIAYVSSVMTLQPGDIVSTGTPEGVGQVFDGDVIEVTVTGIDPLRVVVSDSGAVKCPTMGARTGVQPPAEITKVTARPQHPG